MYGLLGFADKLKIQNCVNSKRKLCTLNVQNVWFCGEIEYPKFHKFGGKLCTLYMYGMSGFAKKLNIQNCVNSTGNCVHYMYGMSSFVEKLNIQNFVKSAGNCVQYKYTKYLDLQIN